MKNTMKPEFNVFKEGVTAKQVTICSMDGKSANGLPFNRAEKMQHYLSMGYTITNEHPTKLEAI